MPERKPRNGDAHPVVKYFAAFLAFSGLLCFAVLAAMYDIFYRQFGLSATDLGMSYTDTLLHSWGSILLIATILSAAVWVANMIAPCIRNRKGKEVDPEQPFYKRPLHWVHAALLLATLSIFGICCGLKVHDKSIDAEAGEAVRPLRLWNSLLMVDIRAQPVTEIVAVTEEDTAIPVAGFTYLGNYDRSFVLYCTDDGKILKISMERFTLRTSPNEDFKGSKNCKNPSVRSALKVHGGK
ncbi:hypothetical protein ACWFQ8_31310 [Streptomyces sp. NPDC055254]